MSEALVLPEAKPIAAGDPCGPDLEAAGDPDYMNCLAHLQGEMPRSYLSYVYPASEDDRVVIDFAGAFKEIGNFSARTHDLRLIVLRARFEILGLKLTAFHESLALIASLLSGYWDEVHPRAEDGLMDRRRIELAALDEATVTFALQYAPLCENRRIGRISWRTYMYAQNKAKPRPGESAPAESALMEAIKQADEDEIGPSRANIAGLITAITQIRTIWQEKVQEPPPLDNLLELTKNIQGLLDLGLPDQPKSLMERASSAIGGLLGTKAAETAPSGSAVSSTADAGEALEALALYFAKVEPSSPALPLIDQAAHLRGKSFYEALQALLPKLADQAAFKIGSQSIFELTLARAAASAKGNGERDGEEDAPPDVKGRSTKTWRVETRQQAIGMMGEIIAFYKLTEPSSPIPWLLDRASGLAERDFMSLLGDVLPKASLKDINQS